MTRIRTLIAISVISLVAACGGPGDSSNVPEAQPAGVTFVERGDWVIHFNAQSTDHLSPEMATVYSITRSNDRPMMTLSVLRQADNAPVHAEVEVSARNRTGQVKSFAVREVEEEAAIYYLGFSGTRVANQEFLIFTVEVKPEGSDEAYEFEFERQFFTD